MKRRLFISLNLPEDIKEAISRELEKIRYGFTDDVRFMDPEQWHITLSFLAQQEDEAVVHYLLENTDAQLAPIELNLKRSPAVLEFEGAQYRKEIKLCLRLWPQDNNTEGFFVAKIMKPVKQ